MGHHDEGAAFEAGADALDKGLLGLGVKGRRRLIQKDHSTWAEEGSGDGDALGLAFAEAGAFFAADGVKAVRKVMHELGDRRVEGVADVLVGCVWLAHEEVVSDGAADQGVALRDINYVAAGAWRYLDLCLSVVECDLAFVRRKEGEHESDEGALAYSCLAYYCCQAAWGEVVGECIDGLFSAVRIGEVHVCEAYADLAFKADRLSFDLLWEFELAESVN